MNYVDTNAIMSPCEKYRYVLTRVWDRSRPACCFMGLNPSTADHRIDDPTIRREVDFADRWGFGSLTKVNLFAFRLTDSRQLEGISQKTDIVGPENDVYIHRVVIACRKIIVAWGKNGIINRRDRDVLRMLRREDHQVFCLGCNGDGTPKHPLYLAKHVEPVAFRIKLPPLFTTRT